MAAALWDRYLTEYVPRFPRPEARADLQRRAYVPMGRYAEGIAIARTDRRWADPGPTGFNWRARAMSEAVMAGDTAGAMAMVDSLRVALVELQADVVNPKARALYTAAQILSVLGRRGEAVVVLREALNNGYRLLQDEELMWYWAPLRDHAPFQTMVRPNK
jgi:hypothetical protein